MFEKDTASMMARASDLCIQRDPTFDLFEQSPQMEEALALPGDARDQVIKARIGQDELRRRVLQLSGHRCCVTGIRGHELLVASHIKPWRDCSPEEKTDVHNVLCLNRFHDALLDRFLMTVNSDMRIVYADRLERMVGSEIYNQWVKPYKILHVNEANRPSDLYLEYHNMVFDEKN